MQTILPVLSALAVSLIAAPALAAGADGDRDELHVDAFASTYVPVSVGVAGRVELPYRIRATVGVGIMPGPYLDTVNALAVGVGWYGEPTANLIDAALKNSLIVHPRVGWRPVPTHGFHFGAGYQVAALGGSLSGAEAIAAATGTEVPDTEGDAAIEVDAAATDHMLTIEAGYEFVIQERLVIDLTLGGAFSVGSSARLARSEAVAEPRPGPAGADRGDPLDPLLRAGEAYLADTLTRYVHTPTLGVMVGYRFR